MPGRFLLFNTSLFLMEAIFAIEITASIIIAPIGIRSLGLNSELAGWIVNSYIYATFASMVVFYVLRRSIARHMPAAKSFYFGICVFIAGNLMCWVNADATLFFTGRVIQGMGGALAMTSELWAACEYYKEKITIPLFWAECGSAIGVVIGPAIGGVIASCGSVTWRFLFLMNALIGIVTALSAWIALKNEKTPKEVCHDKPFRMENWFLRLVFMQCAVAALAIGAEFLMSDYIQIKLQQSSRFVSILAIIASVGSILGGKWMAGYNRLFTKCAKAALAVLVIAHIGLATSLFTGNLILSVPPVFLIGICMGMANVAIYAKIAKKIEPIFFLPATIIYLIGIQIGSAVGIQSISLTESRGWPLFNTEIIMILMAIVPVILIAIYPKLKQRFLN